MKEETAFTPSGENKTKSSNFQKRVRDFFVAAVGGLVVLGGQVFFNPIIAKRVKTQESITEKRYEACEKAINVLQKSLASAPWITGNVPEGYTPPEKAPTQLELNVAYSLLAMYGKSGSVAEEFLYAFGFEKNEVGQWVKKPIAEINSPAAVGKFILKLREEMDIKGTGVDPNTFGYLFKLNRKDL